MDLFERGYNIRAHSYGTGTDSLCLDAQNFIERTSLIHAMAMSNASVLGGMASSRPRRPSPRCSSSLTTRSWAAQRLRAGLDVNDETIDWDELIEGIDKDPTFQLPYERAHLPPL